MPSIIPNDFDWYYTHEFSPVVTNEARAHHEGPPTALAELLADSLQRSSYNCFGRSRYIIRETCTPADDHG